MYKSITNSRIKSYRVMWKDAPCTHKKPCFKYISTLSWKSVSTGAEEIVQWLGPHIVLAEDMTCSQLTDSMTHPPPTPPLWIFQCCWDLKIPSLTCTTLPTDIHVSKMIFKCQYIRRKEFSSTWKVIHYKQIASITLSTEKFLHFSYELRANAMLSTFQLFSAQY